MQGKRVQMGCRSGHPSNRVISFHNEHCKPRADYLSQFYFSPCLLLLRSDKLAAILVQCAYELKQEAEESLFVQHYAIQGSIPFPVALIWCVIICLFGGRRLARVSHFIQLIPPTLHSLYLFSRLQVCLAKGGAHYGTVRRVLMQLLVTLKEEEEGLLQSPPSARPGKKEAQVSLPQPQEEGGDEGSIASSAAAAAPAAAAVEGEGEDGIGKEEDEAERAERRRSLVGMYGQVMELLVLKVMLALGEGKAALERVTADKHLEGRVRQVTLFDEGIRIIHDQGMNNSVYLPQR